MKHITQAELHELFEYRDGKLINKIDRGKAKKGKEISHSKSEWGYLIASLRGKIYRVHRLVYLFHYGYLPEYLDHADGNPENNRITNLRPCSIRQNNQNAKIKSTNTSGIKGVTWKSDRKKWEAQLRVQPGKVKYLGCYTDIKDAEKAVRAAREKHHKGFCNHG